MSLLISILAFGFSLLFTIPAGIGLAWGVEWILVVLPKKIVAIPGRILGWLFPPKFEPFQMDRFQFEYYQREWMKTPSLFRLAQTKAPSSGVEFIRGSR